VWAAIEESPTVLLTVIADYGTGDLAFAEVRQRLAALLPEADVAAVPVPAFDTVSVRWIFVNVAVADLAASIVSVQSLVPEQAPLQPLKVEPLAAVAVNVTTVPAPKANEQVAPQSIPAGRARDAARAGARFRHRQRLRRCPRPVLLGCRRGKKTRMESASDWAEGGVQVHIAGEGTNGFRVVDVWESEDAFRRFGEKLMPILQELGITIQPDLYPPLAVIPA
jgi:hypothetical protein